VLDNQMTKTTKKDRLTTKMTEIRPTTDQYDQPVADCLIWYYYISSSIMWTVVCLNTLV